MPRQPLRFAIDMDGTFSRDPQLFREMVDLIRKHGHEAICVSARTEDTRTEVEKILDGLMPLIMSGHRWKKEFCENVGLPIDIWIDDACTEITPAPADSRREFTPDLYMAAKEICHKYGYEWTDPRTGIQYPPPKS